MNDSNESHLPDHALPEGSVVDCEDLIRPIDEEYDFVVIGSGAGGAVAAHTLASAGWSVAIVEEGPWVKSHEFKDDVNGTFKRALRDGGTQVLKGRTFMPMLQGRCVGGSTLINSAIAWRTPEDVIDDWRDRFGIGNAITMADLEPHFEALERDLSVRSVADDVLGTSNALFLKTARARGIVSQPMRRYDKGCTGSGQCITGCPSGAKQGMNISYVPWALALGARIFTSCRAERVEVRGGRAVGVVASGASWKKGHGTHQPVFLRARRGVFVAASTIQTPNLLRRSGLRARAIGRHFQTHPGLGMGALFDSPIRMSFGATQGAESIHFRKTERFKLETIGMPPELAAARVPGAGLELSKRLASFANVAVWVAQVRAEAEGTISRGWDGRDNVSLSLTPRDMHAVRKAGATIARLFFDAGAKEVWPGVFGLPSVMRSPDEVRLMEEGPTDSRAYNFIATHLFGAARMGADPRTSAVGLDFSTHEARALYVVDSSIFPTNLGVNPQHSIMALSRLAATRVASASSREAAA